MGNGGSTKPLGQQVPPLPLLGGRGALPQAWFLLLGLAKCPFKSIPCKGEKRSLARRWKQTHPAAHHHGCCPPHLEQGILYLIASSAPSKVLQAPLRNGPGAAQPPHAGLKQTPGRAANGHSLASHVGWNQPATSLAAALWGRPR